MVLTEDERGYFMQGIAVWMAGAGFQNQVTREQLDRIVATLYSAMPDDDLGPSSTMSADAQHFTARPLRERLADRDDQLDALVTDVRTYGLLVRDFSRPSAFTFSHKSFGEFLVADFAARRIGRPGPIDAAILSTVNYPPDRVVHSPEVTVFLGEILTRLLASDGGEASAQQLLEKLVRRGRFNLQLWLVLRSFAASRRRFRRTLWSFLIVAMAALAGLLLTMSPPVTGDEAVVLLIPLTLMVSTPLFLTLTLSAVVGGTPTSRRLVLWGSSDGGSLSANHRPCRYGIDRAFGIVCAC